ncbi:hypothetical protein C1H69_22130 [Billgrantia endophytica]|uniref:Uncharacterized protein n=1 Tax=Billgrantia endophytica TaxID=2033802 RepID=A0A2N7TV67_9GAMM|nr:hypothetical protein C1H69_22130 [Halomonas endophytica]
MTPEKPRSQRLQSEAQGGGEVLAVHRGGSVGHPVGLQHLVQRLPLGQEGERLEGFLGEARRQRFQRALTAESLDPLQQHLRHTQPQQLAVAGLKQRFDGCAGWCLWRRFSPFGGHFLGGGGENLQAAGLRMDIHPVTAGPGVVVFVHPQQHVDVAALGLEYDGAVIVVDADRAQVGIGRGQGLVVEPRRARVFAELGDHGHHLALFATGNSGIGFQELLGQRDGDLAHGSLLSSMFSHSANRSMAASSRVVTTRQSARTCCQPVGRSSSMATATRGPSQASSRVMDCLSGGIQHVQARGGERQAAFGQGGDPLGWQ